MEMDLIRLRTGISGFDKIIQGGIPKGFVVLVSGAPGTGKSIFGLEYIYKGAIDGERGLYVSLLQKASGLITQAEIFGWDFRSLLGSNMVEMLEIDILDFNVTKIINEIKKGSYERVVIDSLTNILSHSFNWKDEDIIFPIIHDADEIVPDPRNPDVSSRILTERVITEIKKIGSTSLILSESGVEREFNRDVLPESLVDGVIHLSYNSFGPSSGRNLIIQKMRSTRHSELIHPIRFVEGEGIEVMNP